MATSVSSSQVKHFSTPDEVHALPKAKMEVVNFGDLAVTRAVFEPGWRWTEQMRSLAGTETCQGTHFTYIVSGRLRTRMDDGTEFEIGPGDVAITAPGHDAWVVGDEPCIGIDFQGASRIG